MNGKPTRKPFKCTQCGTTSPATYTPGCGACAARRRHTEQQRKRRTGTHAPSATLTPQQVAAIATLVDQLRTTAEAADVERARVTSHFQNKLQLPGVSTLISAAGALANALDTTLAEPLAAARRPAPRPYGPRQ